MNPSQLADMSLRDFCELYRTGNLSDQIKDMTLSEIVAKANEEASGKEVSTSGGLGCESSEGEKKFMWRESLPNSNDTNVPLLLWRGDENNEATLALAFGLYDSEFSQLEKDDLEVEVNSSDVETVLFSVDLDYPKDEKLSRKHFGLAGSGSDYLCTYCSSSRKTVKDPPYSGDAPVTLTNTLLTEASRYCQFNPQKKNQSQLSKISFGSKEFPLSSTEPINEKPDALHLDINVTKHLVTIASRLYHHKESGQPLKYEKAEVDQKEMDSSEAKYHKILREKIRTLPEITQYPGNFAREFCDPANTAFIRNPLPNIPDTEVWNELMTLWRKMRSVHKPSEDPSDEEIAQYKSWVIEFQEKIFSLKWVPVANQIHRCCHVAFFMQSKSIRSIGAYSLEGRGYNVPEIKLLILKLFKKFIYAEVFHYFFLFYFFLFFFAAKFAKYLKLN